MLSFGGYSHHLVLSIIRHTLNVFRKEQNSRIAARRTFVVHALEQGMSPEMVMTFTGHNDYDTMKPYIALTDKTRQNAMLNSFKMGEERS